MEYLNTMFYVTQLSVFRESCHGLCTQETFTNYTTDESIEGPAL